MGAALKTAWQGHLPTAVRVPGGHSRRAAPLDAGCGSSGVRSNPRSFKGFPPTRATPWLRFRLHSAAHGGQTRAWPRSEARLLPGITDSSEHATMGAALKTAWQGHLPTAVRVPGGHSRRAAPLDAAGASQAIGSCKQQSSSAAGGGLTAGIGQSRQRRTYAQHGPFWSESGRRRGVGDLGGGGQATGASAPRRVGVEVALGEDRNVADTLAGCQAAEREEGSSRGCDRRRMSVCRSSCARRADRPGSWCCKLVGPNVVSCMFIAADRVRRRRRGIA